MHVHSPAAQEINELLYKWRHHPRLVGNYTSEGTFHVKGRGDIKTIRLERSQGSTYGHVRAWVGETIRIDGEIHNVRGVETFAMGDERLCTQVGVLI